MYLGIKAVIAQSFARIHRSNLVNFGILPLTFTNPADYDRIAAGDTLAVDLSQGLEPEELTVTNTSKGYAFKVHHGLSPRQQAVILAGGLLNYTRQQAGK
jgi:aconitate hydratase